MVLLDSDKINAYSCFSQFVKVALSFLFLFYFIFYFSTSFKNMGQAGPPFVHFRPFSSFFDILTDIPSKQSLTINGKL